jgi:hypothetical protein
MYHAVQDGRVGGNNIETHVGYDVFDVWDGGDSTAEVQTRWTGEKGGQPANRIKLNGLTEDVLGHDWFDDSMVFREGDGRPEYVILVVVLSSR